MQTQVLSRVTAGRRPSIFATDAMGRFGTSRLQPQFSSLAAVIAAAALMPACLVTPAQAQSSCSSASCLAQQQAGLATVLSPLLTLMSTSQGTALLAQNQATVTNIYKTATLPLQQLAVTNSVEPFEPYYATQNIWGMVNSPVASSVVSLNAANNLPSVVQNLLTVAYGTTQVEYLKQYFGNYNVYGIAYNYTGPVAVGDPRPFLTNSYIASNPWPTTLPSGLAQNQAGQWASNQIVQSYQSGHATYGYTTGLLYAVLVPQQYQQLMVAAQSFGYSRNVLGLHYPLDVIGGRIDATYNLVQLLTNNPNFSSDFGTYVQPASQTLAAAIGGVSAPYAQCAANVAGCLASGVFPSAATLTANTAAYISSITYDLPSVGSTTDLPIVPQNAGVLIATRFPYLSASQLYDVLYSTELPSGVPLDDHLTGWARLNLYSAAGGYGAFAQNVTVNMDAAQGGFSAIDFWSNNISGPGGLTKLGTGTLVLGGNNTYTGGTIVGGGTLALSGTLVGNLSVWSGATFITAGGYAVSSGSLLNNAGTFQSVNASLSNNGTVINTGVLASDLANAGLTTNNGTIIGNVTNSGMLMGNGLIVGRLTNRGTVAPGNSVGTISVAGPVIFTAGSTYLAELGAGGSSDLIVASGPITIEGGTLLVTAGAGVVPQLGGSYTLLSSASGISGAFSSVSASFSAYPFLNVTAAGTSAVTVVPNAAALVAASRSANQAGVAAAASGLPASNSVIQALTLLNTTTGPAALDGLSGQIYASAATVLQEQSTYLRQAIGERQRQAPGAAGAAGPQVASLAPGWAASLWLQAYGSWGDTNATAGTSQLSRNVGGVLAGIDTPLGEAWRLGIAGGYSQANYAVDTLSSSGSGDTYDLALYASTRLAEIDVRVGGAYSWHDLSTTRTVSYPGFVNGLHSSNDGATTQVFGELAKSFALGAAVAEPFAGLAYVHLHLDGFTETGGAAALSGGALTQDNTFTALGARISQTIPFGPGSLTARGSLAWQHAFGDINPSLSLAFASGSAPFTVSGAPIGSDAALVTAGLDYRAGANVVMGIAYSGQISNAGQDNAINARLAVSF